MELFTCSPENRSGVHRPISSTGLRTLPQLISNIIEVCLILNVFCWTLTKTVRYPRYAHYSILPVKIDGHHPVAFSDIGPMNRIEKLSDLARRMHNLTETIQDGSDVEERTRHLAHELRTRLGVALILAEGLARDEGNKSMVAVEENGTTGHISYDIALGETLSETNIADVSLQ